jgi:hypothetical protein
MKTGGLDGKLSRAYVERKMRSAYRRDFHQRKLNFAKRTQSDPEGWPARHPTIRTQKTKSTNQSQFIEWNQRASSAESQFKPMEANFPQARSQIGARTPIA